MILEVLCEDKSSVPVLEHFLIILQKEYSSLFEDYYIYPHRGKGKLPEDPQAEPKPFSASLLDLLPAKIRAYRQVYQPDELVLIIVLDADDDNVNELYKNIAGLLQKEAADQYFIIGISVEEMEAWLLGDRQAILEAYPNADFDLIKDYEQDSINHTWEFLAKVILKEKADSLIKAGYPAIGIYKNRWALDIAPYLKIENNQSPSFQIFIKHFRRVMNWIEENEQGYRDA